MVAKTHIKVRLRDNYIGMVDVGFLAGVSLPTVQGWIRDGIITEVVPQGYDAHEVWDAVWKHKAREGPSSSRKIIDEQKALKLQRENSVADRKLISLEKHLQAVDQMMVVFRSWVRALPGRMASTCIMVEAAVVRENARIECARVIEEMREASEVDFEEDTLAPVEDDETDTHSGRMGRAN
jgi:hypothetical protein